MLSCWYTECYRLPQEKGRVLDPPLRICVGEVGLDSTSRAGFVSMSVSAWQARQGEIESAESGAESDALPLVSSRQVDRLETGRPRERDKCRANLRTMSS